MFYELFEQKVLDKCQPAAVLTQRLGSANMFVSSPPAPRFFPQPCGAPLLKAARLRLARLSLNGRCVVVFIEL